MAAEKLSISLDSALAGDVRAAAAEEGVSVSTWLADAAMAKARQHALRAALDEYAAEFGSLTEEEIDRLIAEARHGSRVTRQGAA